MVREGEQEPFWGQFYPFDIGVVDLQMEPVLQLELYYMFIAELYQRIDFNIHW